MTSLSPPVTLFAMIIEIWGKKGEGLHWIDVIGPSEEEMYRLAQEYGIHRELVEDALDPTHLPKFETIGNISFLIVRAYDRKAPDDADSVEDLTRKVAIFIGDNFIITTHRIDQVFWKAFREQYINKNHASLSATDVVADILEAVVETYEQPIDQYFKELYDFEQKIFNNRGDSDIFEEGYFLKRKVSILKRLLRITSETILKLNSLYREKPFRIQNVKEAIDHIYFDTDEFLDTVNTLLNLHISMASQKTNEASHKINEVIRVLTVFSVFFMPLNFIASIYGMNFENIPELRWERGYFLVLGLMVFVSVSIFIWFRKKGWLDREDISG